MHAFGCVRTLPVETIANKSLESDYDQPLSGTGVMSRGHFDLLKAFEKCSRYKHKSTLHIPSAC